MALKQAPKVWTGYMNFSPDLVSSDFAEPRAQSLGQQGARRANIAAQNTKVLSKATRSAPKASRFKLQKTEARREADRKYDEDKTPNKHLSKPERYAQTKYSAAKTATKSYLKEKFNQLRGSQE